MGEFLPAVEDGDGTGSRIFCNPFGNGQTSMMFFGKKIPKKARKGLIKIACLIVGICAVLSLPLIASLGWFSFNPRMQVTGMQVVVSTDCYELLIDRSAERYNESLTDEEGKFVYPGIGDMKTKIEDDGFDLTEVTTSDAAFLAFELTNEYIDTDGHYSLIPGSYGTLTFYLRPRDGADGSVVTLSLEVDGYQSAYDLEDNLEIVPVEDETALNMLNGHLLFFQTRTGARPSDYQYDDLIESGCFLYDMSQHSKSLEEGKTDCYEITLYWEWPLTYEEIYNNTGTVSPAVVKRYPPELSAYVSAHPEYFFATNVDSVVFDRLVDGYNDGDQAIGDSVHYLVVKIW